MRKEITLIFTLIAILLPTFASAALPKMELLPEKALLQIGSFRQWVALGYDFSDHSSGSFRSNTNKFTEKYHIDVDAIVYDPDFLEFTANGEIWLDQSFGGGSNSSSSNELLGQYGVDGSFFARSNTPVIFSSSFTNSNVVNAYSPAYDMATNSNFIWLRQINKYVPFDVRYSYQTIDRSGGGMSSSSSGDNLNIHATNGYKNISTTDLNLGYSSNNSKYNAVNSKSSNYTLSLSNVLDLDQRNKYPLDSSLSINESRTDGNPSRDLYWQERLHAHFGRALEGSLGYSYNRTETTGFNRANQTMKSNIVDASLSHKLFSSLYTHAFANYRISDYLGGKETGYNINGGFSYKKKLTDSGKLEVNFDIGHGMTDRNLTGSLMSVRPISPNFISVDYGNYIDLKNSGTLVAVVSITSDNPPATYSPITDYVVDTNLKRIYIPLGSSIVPGTPLLISYTYTLDNIVKYNTDNVDSTATLSLFNNRHVFHGEFHTNKETPIASATYQNLQSTTSMLLRYNYNLSKHVFGAEIGNSDSTNSKYSYGEGLWRYNDVHLNLSSRDRYTNYQGISGSKAYMQNTFDVSAGYATIFFSWLQGLFSASYVNSYNSISYAGHSGSFSQNINLRVGLNGFINKLQVNMTGQSSWRLSRTTTQRDDYIHLEIKRFF